MGVRVLNKGVGDILILLLVSVIKMILGAPERESPMRVDSIPAYSFRQLHLVTV